MTTYTIRAVSPAGERVQYVTQADHGCDAVTEALDSGYCRVAARPHRPADLVAQTEYERSYWRQLARHSDPRDPDHPGRMYETEGEDE